MLVPLGKDFTDIPSKVTIPASPVVNGIYEIPANFTTIEDDGINEFKQSFILVAEIGDEVPDHFVCFQRLFIVCRGRVGATEIRIVDNDGEYFCQQQDIIISLQFLSAMYCSTLLDPCECVMR